MHLSSKPYRLIHDGTKVIQGPFHAGKAITYIGAGKTGFEADSEKACWDEIERLGLEVPEGEKPDEPEEEDE